MEKKISECEGCGAKLEARTNICPKCGRAVKKPIYKRRWFQVAIIIVAILVIGNIVMGGGDDTKESLKKADAPVVEEGSAATGGYQGIYDEYAQKIREKAPSVSMTELAEISTEGVTKMAEYMYKAKGVDGQMATYQSWAEKLTEVYMEEAR